MNDQRSSHNHGHLRHQRVHAALAAPETASPDVLETQPWSVSYECFFQQMLDGCVLISENGHVLDANPAYCEMVRYSRDQLRKMKVSDLEALHGPDEIAETIALFVGGIPRHFRTQHRRSDGSLIDLEPLPQAVIRDAHEGHAILCMFRDITEKKRLEEALERSEERFSKAFFANPTASVIVESKTRRIVDMNQAAVSLLGYSREKAVGRTATELGVITNSLEEEVLRLLLRRSRRVRSMVGSCRTLAGELRELELYFETIPLGGKRCILVTFLDVTARREAERRLLETHTKLEDRVCERTHKLKQTNDELRAEIVQRQRAEAAVLCQRDIALLLAKADSFEEGLLACVKRLIQTPEIDGGGIYLVEDDGSVSLRAHAGFSRSFIQQTSYYRPGSPHAALASRGEPCYFTRIQDPGDNRRHRRLRDAGIRSAAAIPLRHMGRSIGCLNVASFGCDVFPPTLCQFLETVASQIGEVVARLGVEEVLRLKERAIACSASGLAIADAKGLIKHANDTCLNLLGFARHADIVGRALQDFSPETDVANLAETAQGWTGEATVRRDDGETFDAQFTLSAITNQAGCVVAIMGSFLDISRQKQAERALLRAEKQRAQAEKYVAAGRMAAKVAHEINNPLSGIANCFQLVKQAVPESHRYQRFVNVIEREIDRIGRIVRQMFELSRPEQHANQPVCVQEAVEDVVTMLSPIARQREVDIQPDVDAGLSGTVISCNGLRQVFYNLVSNAIEASPPGGSVKLTARVANDKFWFIVADNGSGIRRELHSRIFEPFFTTKEDADSGGLGLGLPICKTIVEAAGGMIEFCSSQGNGATFCVVFPVEPEKHSASGNRQSPRAVSLKM